MEEPYQLTQTLSLIGSSGQSPNFFKQNAACSRYCIQWGISTHEEDILTHATVQVTLKNIELSGSNDTQVTLYRCVVPPIGTREQNAERMWTGGECRRSNGHGFSCVHGLLLGGEKVWN